LAQPNPKTELVAFAESVRTDPCAFIENTLNTDLFSYQQEIVDAVFSHPRVAVRSGNGIGKSLVSAAIAIAFLMSYPLGSYVILTSSTWRNIKTILFGELRKLVRRNKLGGDLQQEKWQLDENWAALCINSDRPEGFQGHHNQAVLVVIDEASALPDAIYEAIIGITTGENDKILQIGNPINTEGPFYNAFHSSNWTTLHYPSTVSPNVQRSKNAIPGLATQQWIDSIAEEYSIDSNVYRARVLGEFPEGSDESLIPLGWYEALPEDLPPSGDKVLGVDVARFGADQTVFVIRDNNNILSVEAHSGWDTMKTCGKIQQLKTEHDIDQVFVDETGVGGGVVDRLREQGVAVSAVTFSASPYDRAQFANVRAEVYWRLRQAIRAGELAIPKHVRSKFLELCSMRYKFNSSGRLQIEEKSEIKRRLTRSPDHAEALVVTYAEPPTVGVISLEEKAPQQAETLVQRINRLATVD